MYYRDLFDSQTAFYSPPRPQRFGQNWISLSDTGNKENKQSVAGQRRKGRHIYSLPILKAYKPGIAHFLDKYS